MVARGKLVGILDLSGRRFHLLPKGWLGQGTTPWFSEGLTGRRGCSSALVIPQGRWLLWSPAGM